MSRDTAGKAPGTGGGLGSPMAERGILARELAGELPCARCGYDLKGLSVRAVCPECGTPIKATLLVVVDPLANELRPIDAPRRVAWGLVVWSGAALVGVAGVALARAVPLMGVASHDLSRALAWLVVASAAVSGVGAALALLWPHRGIRNDVTRSALAGVLVYVPLVACVYLATQAPAAVRWWNVLCLALMAAILVLLRPVARVLQARSFLLRTNQVDRQTMRVLAVAAGIAALGELVRVVAANGARVWSDVAGVAGALVVAAVWMLIGVGFFGMLLDSWRLRGVILQPPLSLDTILGRSRPPAQVPSSPAERAKPTVG